MASHLVSMSRRMKGANEHPAKYDYQPVCFSRPKQDEKFEDWVERLVQALDRQGVFGEEKAR